MGFFFFFYPINSKLLLRPKAGDKSSKYKYLMIERTPSCKSQAFPCEAY